VVFFNQVDLFGSRRAHEKSAPSYPSFSPFIRNPNLDSEAQRVPRQPQQSCRLALVAIGTAQSLLDHLVFPLLQGHAIGRK